MRVPLDPNRCLYKVYKLGQKDRQDKVVPALANCDLVATPSIIVSTALRLYKKAQQFSISGTSISNK
jgi:hypothetical protein